MTETSLLKRQTSEMIYPTQRRTLPLEGLLSFRDVFEINYRAPVMQYPRDRWQR